MADPVYLHWARLWILTPDGLGPVLQSSQRIFLRDVRFVIDPVGLAISRNTGKRKTHAWAIGTPIGSEAPDVYAEGLVWQDLIYRPRRGDDHFTVHAIQTDSSIQWWLQGADYLDADHERGQAVARIAGPRFGETERRQVQQYGGRR